LARDTAGNEIDRFDAPAVQMVDQLRRIGQIAGVPETADVGCVRLDGALVDIGGEENREAGVPETEAQASRTAEKVDGGRS
jgi:hypothetical protein